MHSDTAPTLVPPLVVEDPDGACDIFAGTTPRQGSGSIRGAIFSLRRLSAAGVFACANTIPTINCTI